MGIGIWPLGNVPNVDSDTLGGGGRIPDGKLGGDGSSFPNDDWLLKNNHANRSRRASIKLNTDPHKNPVVGLMRLDFTLRQL